MDGVAGDGGVVGSARGIFHSGKLDQAVSFEKLHIAQNSGEASLESLGKRINAFRIFHFDNV